MPIAVGIYLPFGLSTPILIGGLISHFVWKGSKGKDEDSALHKGLLVSSGLIAGESLMGVGLAILASIGISRITINLMPELAVFLTSLCAFFTISFLYLKSKSIN